MIITHLMGGLGNQMFQYAAGLALAEARRTVLKLDVSWFREYEEFEPHNRYALSCFNVTEQFATEEEVARLRGVQLTRTERWSVSLAKLFRFRQYAGRFEQRGSVHRHDEVGASPAFFNLPDGTYLTGMWQSESFFLPVADLLRLHFSFRYPAPPAVQALAEQIRSGPSAAVHFRRGDYLTNPDFRRNMGALGAGYYWNALEILYKTHPGVTLYIFSDDIDSVEKEFKPPGPHVFARVTRPFHSYDKIRLMSLCDHAVIANSSFSWWAAWLNPNPNKLVIAPDPWFASSSHGCIEIVPAGWTRVEAAG